MLEPLDRRDCPATIPAGLSQVSPLGLWATSPMIEYVETHAVTLRESNSVTVDQAGTGAAGTFTIEVAGSADSADTAEANGIGYSGGVTGSGSGAAAFTYHLAVTGVYANGVFTVVGETYTETGSSSVSTTATLTISPGYTYEWDATRSETYTRSWSAALSDGQLTYTSYSSAVTKTAHWHSRWDFPTGGYADSSWDSLSTLATTGSGSTAAYTGSNEWQEHQLWSYPDPNGGPPYEVATDSGWSYPVSGTAWLYGVYVPTSGWSWRAGTPDATGFTFHGTASETSSVTEEASYHVTNYSQVRFDVDSFSSSYQASYSGQVVDDEPGVSASGTGTGMFHRDEMYSADVEVTGSGSYVDGSADADYQAVETGAFAVANSYTVTNDGSSGYDENGDPFDLVFNFSRDSSGNGSSTITHNYRDSGDGLELTAVSGSESGSAEFAIRSWGAANGVAFDDTSTPSESGSSSFAFGGEPGPVSTPDGMEAAFPLQGMTTASVVVFVQPPMFPEWAPTSTVPGLPGQIQNWYNHRVDQIGAAAKGKAIKNEVKAVLLAAIQDNNPGGVFPRPYGVYTFNEGGIFALGIGIDKELGKAKESQARTYSAIWKNVSVGPTTVTITYAVDQANLNPRSGKLVAVCVFNTTFTGTFNGQPITRVVPMMTYTFEMHDGKLERMQFQN